MLLTANFLFSSTANFLSVDLMLAKFNIESQTKIAVTQHSKFCMSLAGELSRSLKFLKVSWKLQVSWKTFWLQRSFGLS